MAQINPKFISWLAPTENTDGSPIVGALAYRLMLDGADFADFPGTLNPDGRYEQPLDVLGLPDGEHTYALKAFYTDSPELISDPSASVTMITGVTAPNAPLDFSAD